MSRVGAGGGGCEEGPPLVDVNGATAAGGVNVAVGAGAAWGFGTAAAGGAGG